jgi:hypothetical protein
MGNNLFLQNPVMISLLLWSNLLNLSLPLLTAFFPQYTSRCSCLICTLSNLACSIVISSHNFLMSLSYFFERMRASLSGFPALLYIMIGCLSMLVGFCVCFCVLTHHLFLVAIQSYLLFKWLPTDSLVTEESVTFLQFSHANVIFSPTFPPLLMLSGPSILHSAAGTIQLCWYYSAFLWLSVPSILHVSNMLLVWYYSTSLLQSAPSILHSSANTIPHHPFYTSPTCCWYGTIPLLLYCYLHHLFYMVLLVLFRAILFYTSLTC